MAKRLIINADDFGLCSGVNRAIIEAHRKGVITSASLMVNLEGFDEAVDLARLTPSLDLGIHITLADVRPLCPPEQIPSLVDRRGYFLRRRRLLALLLRRKIQRSDIEREILAQVKKFLNTGLKTSHIDGDQHVHIFPVIRSIALDIARALGVAVRIPAERIIWRGGHLEDVPLAFFVFLAKTGLRVLSRSLRRACQTRQIPTNDYFTSLFGMLPRRTPCPDDFVKLANTVGSGITELMVHPAFTEESVVQFWGGRENLAVDREREFYALIGSDFINAIRRNGIVLSTYSALESDYLYTR